jgi:CoA:oxalate CoA-transferase
MTIKPLEGIKVLDFTNVLAGPTCTMLLANMGAEIIKLERPGCGDDSRAYGPHINGESVYFTSVNRGKKSVVCNTKTEAGRQVFLKLVEKVDVVIENIKPGGMVRMGFDYETLKKINPRMIYVSISGFGNTGPWALRPCYDMIVQAMGGIMSITGEPGGSPVRVGTSIGDVMGGTYAAMGTLGALYQRAVTGLGQKVDISLLDCQVAILENAVARYSSTGFIPGPLGMRHALITPFEGFKTKDRTLIIAAGNDNLFTRLCRVIGLPELCSDPRFLTNASRTDHVDALRELLEARLADKTADEWMEILHAEDIPCGAINTIDKLFENPQLAARNMLVEVDQPGIGKVSVAGNPIKYSTVPADEELPSDPAPAVGQHTREILVDLLGYSSEEADAYIEEFLS